MPGMIPSAILMTSSALMAVSLFFYLYQQYHEVYMKIWGIASFGFALGPLFGLLSLESISEDMAILGEEFVFLVSGVLLFKGIYIFLAKKYPRPVNYGIILTTGWLIFGYLKKLPFIVYTLPVFVLIAYLFVQAGTLLFLNRRVMGTGGIIGGWALIIAGLNLLDYPFIRRNNWLGSWGYLMGAVCIVAIAVGILLFYFQKFRRDLGVSEARYRFMAENARDIVYRLQVLPELKYEFISAAVSEITGYIPEEFYQDPRLIFKIVHPNYLSIMRQLVTGEYDYSKKVTLYHLQKLHLKNSPSKFKNQGTIL